jgi:myo-inositol-1(or 4)-monophosphatase
MDTIEFTTKLALETGELLLSYYQNLGIQAQMKSDKTVVTKADLAADQHLRRQISLAYPNDFILSEEANTIYPTNETAVWIIDPLDGTTNFSLGFHYWGISISRIVNGFPELGVLYFPLLDELYTASKNAGAYLNGKPLKVNTSNPSQPIKFFSCCSRAFRSYDIGIKYKTRILGSAAYGLITVARGSALLAFEVTPKVWDFSASWIITQEAGGLISHLEGESPFPLTPGLDYENKSFPLLTAATSDLLIEGQTNIRKRRKHK